MSILLNKKLVTNLTIGSSFYGCGGGLKAEINKKGCIEAIKNKEIYIKNLDEFKKDDILGVISAIGKPENKKYNFENILNAGNDCISKILPGKKLKGLVPGEIGIESLVLKMARELNLPVLDGDIVGGRAVPEIQDDIFYIYKIKTTPLICINFDKEILIIDEIQDLKKIENIVRNFAVLSKGPVVVFDHITSREKFRNISLGTLSRSMELGKNIRNKQGKESLKEILKFNNAKIVADGKIDSVEENRKEGFLEKNIKGRNWNVFIKNECLAVFINNRLSASIPDIIVLVDKESGKPLHNTEVVAGQEIWIVVMKAFKKWYSKRGLEIFGPRSIGFDN